MLNPIFYYILKKYLRFVLTTKMEIPGTIGSKQVVATLSPSFSLNCKNKVLMSNVWLGCFQRVSSQLKQCDIVWIGDNEVLVQTIDTKYIDTIKQWKQIPIHNIGLDPGPWTLWKRTAKKQQWTAEQWIELLNPTVDCSDSDSSWNPDGEEEYDSAEYDSDGSE